MRPRLLTPALVSIWWLLTSFASEAGQRESSNYSISAEITGASGGRSANGLYSNDGTLELVAGQSAAGVPQRTAKHGYVGQLYDVLGFILHADSNTVSENANLQLIGARLLDDATRLALPPASVAWSVESGPLVSISANGLATADTVYTHTNATAGGVFEGNNSTLLLTVLNVNPDNLPGYAGDQIDDDWQVTFFGFPPNPNAGPNVDADGSGHGNLFKFIAGLNPLDGSRFSVSNAPMPEDPSLMTITFRPIVTGRTYTVQSTVEMGVPDWAPLTNSGYIDNGDERTVTDYNALPAPKFYRVEITRP